mmetsp:Transcript_16320/g.41692  ORF Transcript_16320/g.41692 Transcript_16320/m.41692 type:complete len:114 (-) Transcript_16320:247-588(-)
MRAGGAGEPVGLAANPQRGQLELDPRCAERWDPGRPPAKCGAGVGEAEDSRWLLQSEVGLRSSAVVVAGACILPQRVAHIDWCCAGFSTWPPGGPPGCEEEHVGGLGFVASDW